MTQNQSPKQETNKMTPTQHALTTAGGFICFWVAIGLYFNQRPLSRLGVGVIVALALGGIHYVMASR
jgi:1,4-dihydroxy-2-naphthoate octaprenyltransferase